MTHWRKRKRWTGSELMSTDRVTRWQSYERKGVPLRLALTVLGDAMVHWWDGKYGDAHLMPYQRFPELSQPA